MESDVTATLSELERKLKELERELESVGRGGEADTEPAQGGWTPPDTHDAPPPPGVQPGPPPPGATPFTASWHGGQPAQAPPPPPPPSWGGQPIPVPPPAAPWQAAGAPPVAQEHAAPAQPAPAPASPADTLHHQLDELVRFREHLVRSANDLVSELSRVLAELGADVPAAGGHAVAPPDPADTVLDGPVVVEAGPFADLGSLAAFEQALARTAGVREVYVRALDTGRATIDVDLAHPVALGTALRGTSPLAFSVEHAGDGRLALTVAPGGPPPR